MRSRLARTVSLFLPGIFLLGFNIGTGSVTAMAKAGATYGMSLLWTIAASCVATYVMINAYGRFTLVTGETALQAFRRHIHPAIAVFFLIALTAGVCGSVIGVMGIVAETSSVWSGTFLREAIDPIWFAALFVALVYIIFWKGETLAFERSLALVVALMAACFVVNFFLLMPPPLEIAKGLLPSIPDVPLDEGRGPFLVIASMVGTTVFSGLFIIRTTLVKEAGWTLQDRRKQRNDALAAVVMMFGISGSIMAAAAGTLHTDGVGLEKAADMVGLLEPLAGSLATTIFVVGIIAAGVSSQFPNVLLLPWLLCDINQSPRDMTLPRYRLIVLVISLLGLVVPVLGARPVLVMIVSQAFNAVILPVTVACIFYLGNRRDLMGEHKNTAWENGMLTAVFLFSLVTTSMGIRGVWQLVTG